MTQIKLPKDKFHVHKKSRRGRCPNDWVKIKGIDESRFPANDNKFPEDTGHQMNEVKLCGKLARDYTFTHKKGKQLILDFSATGSENLKGFRAEICLAWNCHATIGTLAILN